MLKGFEVGINCASRSGSHVLGGIGETATCCNCRLCNDLGSLVKSAIDPWLVCMSNYHLLLEG